MLKRIFFSFLVFSNFALTAQIGGSSTYEFLSLSSSPLHSSLGAPIPTLSDLDIHSSLSNPALLHGRVGGQWSLNFEPYFAGVNRGSAAYAITLNRKKALLFDIRYIHYGTFEGRDELGNPTTDFSGNETALGVSHSHYFLKLNLSVGARLSLISSSFEKYHSFGVSTDFGFYYHFLNSSYRIGLVLRNIGSQITTYADINEPLPFEIGLGVSNELLHLPLRWHLYFQNVQNWKLAFENSNRTTTSLNGEQTEEKLGGLDELFRHIVLGIELFPDRSFSIQLGYNFRRAAELRILEQRSFSGITAGFGLSMRRLRFHFSHARYTSAGNTSFFGISFNPDL